MPSNRQDILRIPRRPRRALRFRLYFFFRMPTSFFDSTAFSLSSLRGNVKYMHSPLIWNKMGKQWTAAPTGTSKSRANSFAAFQIFYTRNYFPNVFYTKYKTRKPLFTSPNNNILSHNSDNNLYIYAIYDLKILTHDVRPATDDPSSWQIPPRVSVMANAPT